MPGSIRVSVLESLDLPAEATGGKYVSIKVNVGKREYQTKPSKADGDRTTAWNSDFTFPVLNLRDNLVVALLDNKGNTISQTDIGMPIIIEKGFWDDLFPLKGGGHVHLRLNFVLTAEERKRIEAMREAALNRKELGILKKNVAIQVLCPVAENGSSASFSSTGIAQANREDGKSKDGSHNKENQIETLVVPQVSQLNEVQKKTQIIEEAAGESSIAFTSSPKYVTIKKASNNDVKGISGTNLQEHGCQDLPQYILEGASISVSSKELIPSSASISRMGIAQATPEDGKNKDGSHKKENQIAILLVPEVSQSNEVQDKTEIIEAVSKESSTASIYPPIEHVTNEKALSQDVKGTYGNNLQGQGCQDLPQHNLEECKPVLSEERTRSKESSFLSSHISSPENQRKGIMWANTLIPDENLKAVMLPHVKDDLAECKTSRTDNLIDKDPMIEPTQTEVEDTRPLLPDPVIDSKISSSQALAAIHQTGEIDAPESPFQQESRTLTSARTFLESCPPPESLHIQSHVNLVSEFTVEGGTSDAPIIESTSLLVNDETANNYLVKFSNKQDIAILGLSTSPSMLLQSSMDGSISPTPFVDIPNEDTAGENICFPPVSPEESQPQEICQTHESSNATEPLHSIVDGGDPAVPVKKIILANHSDPAFGAESVQCSEDLSVAQSFSNVVNAEKTELLVQDVCPVENNRTDSSNRVFPLDAGSGSLADWPAALHEGSSLKIVHNQSKSVSVVNSMVELDTASSVSTCFASLPATQTMKGNSTQSSVKAKIKAFESNISQDSDHHTSPQVKSDHKTEAERARQRLRAEAAAVEAAEARRRAEEEELKSKSIAKGRERKSSFQEKLEESRLRSSGKVKRKCLGKNEDEDERGIQENIKDIAVAEEDIRQHEADRRKDGEIQKVDEKRLEVGERNRWQEDMTALRRPMQKQQEKPWRVIETTEKTMKNDPEENALTWERIRLGELQLKRNSRDKSVKPGLSGNKNEGGEKSRVNASTMESSSRKAYEQKKNLEALTSKSQLLKDKTRSAAEISLITAEKRKTRGDQRIQIGNDIIDDNQKAKPRQGSENDLIIEQRVQLIAPENSFAEDIPTEEGSAILKEELGDLVNSSKSFGRLIKQAMCAAALLAAGALFMWAREERMNRRRDHITQSQDKHNILQKNEASSRSLRDQSGEPNSRNSNPSSKVMNIEEITHTHEPFEEIFVKNTSGSCRIDNLVNQIQIKTQGCDSNKGSSLTTVHLPKKPMTSDSNIGSKVQGLTMQEVEDLVNPSDFFSIYDGDATSGGELQISLFTHAKMHHLASLIYKEIYGMEPTNQTVPMYFAMQLYAHLVIGQKVDFRSIPEKAQTKNFDHGTPDQIYDNVNIDYEHMLNSKFFVAPPDIEQRVQSLIEEKNQIESIFQRECQHLQTFAHAFCVISERARQDIDMAKSELNGLVNTKKDLETSLKNIELQLKHAYLDNLDMLEAQRSRCVAQVGDAMQQLRAMSTWILELQGRIKYHREQALQTLMLVKEMKQRGRLLQEHDMLSRGTQEDSYKVLYNRFLFFPYLGGTLKSQNLDSISHVDIHKPCCCVCLSTLQQDGFYGLQCGHLYHFSCLLIHMIGQNKCATCKDEISHETYLNLGMGDFIPSVQILDEVGLPLDCTPKKYL